VVTPKLENTKYFAEKPNIPHLVIEISLAFAEG
jgi:hypothetical protein